MSFLAGLGGPLAGALGGAITPVSGIGMAGGPLSGLGALKALFGGGGDGGSDTPQAPQPNAAATGLGKLIGADPSKVSAMAERIGKGMNQIAAGGGASEGYAAPELPQMPRVSNHLQLLDDNVLQALVRHFSGARY